MNNFYSLLLACLALGSVSFGQCDINYDFGDAGFGVSPDTQLGETFDNAEVGINYYDILHVLVPEFASDVDPIYPPTLPIDSLTVISITVQDTVTWEEYPLEYLGLNYVCNNNGDSEDDCTFLGGEQYCASIEGVPTTSGVFQLNLHIEGHIFIWEYTAVPLTFSNFLINIHCNLLEEPAITNVNGDAGSLGSIDITPLDGIDVISYEWYNEDGVLISTDQDVNNLEVGVYDVFVETSECTSHFENIEIVDESIDCTLSASYVVTDEIPGISLGSVDLTVTGANGSPSFLWTDADGIPVSTDEDLLNVSAGHYMVTITDEDGCEFSFSNIFVEVNSVDDVELNQVSLSPNPANNTLNISLTNDLQSSIEVLDARGRIVHSGTIIKNDNLNVSGLEQGIYFLTISNDFGKTTSRVLIER